MAKVSRSILNGYNKCSALATKWTNILDSFRHKDEKIAIEDIDGDLTVTKEIIDALGVDAATLGGQTKVELLNGYIRGRNGYEASIDDLVNMGFYQLSTSTTGTSPVVGFTTGDIVRVLSGWNTNKVLQVFYNHEGSTYRRFSLDNGTNWSNWVTQLDTSNFDDSEYAKLSGATFIGDVTAPAFIGDGSKLTGVPLPDNWVSKVMTLTTPKFVYYNGSIYEFVLDLSTQPNNEYTTTDIQAELDGEELIWVNKISTYPKPDFVTFEPVSVSPNTTKTLSFYGSFLTKGTIIDFGSDVTINFYTYISENHFEVNITTNATLQTLSGTISNGVRVALQNQLTITTGTIIVPGDELYPFVDADSHFTQNNNNTITGYGFMETVAIGGGFGYGFYEMIPDTVDFVLSYRIGDEKPSSGSEYIYAQFKTSQTTDLSGSSVTTMNIWNGSDGSIYAHNIFGSSNNDYRVPMNAHDLVEIRVVGSDFQLFINGVESSTKQAKDRSAGLWIYFKNREIGKVYDIQLTVV